MSSIQLYRVNLRYWFRISMSDVVRWALDFSFEAVWKKQTIFSINWMGKTESLTSFKAVSLISRRHSFTNFMGHQPSCFVTPNSKQSLHLKNRNTYFVHCHVVDQPIPLQQRHTCFVKNSTSSDACLMTTAPAIKLRSMYFPGISILPGNYIPFRY